MPEVCPTCGGTGAAKGATVNTCPECKGRGTVSFGQGGFAVNRPCPVCRGKGTVPSQRCPTCQGAGEVRVEKRINVDIPAGVEEGARLRLKNQGPKGRGDLIVQVHIAPDRFFRREGLDLIGVVPINLAQALLGSRIKVKTLDDKRVVLRIPAGTQHGQKFRIPGHGIEKKRTARGHVRRSPRDAAGEAERRGAGSDEEFCGEGGVEVLILWRPYVVARPQRP